MNIALGPLPDVEATVDSIFYRSRSVNLRKLLILIIEDLGAEQTTLPGATTQNRFRTSTGSSALLAEAFFGDEGKELGRVRECFLIVFYFISVRNYFAENDNVPYFRHSK